MDKKTKLIHPKRVTFSGSNRPLIDPIYRSVKYTFDSLEEALADSQNDNFFEYSRDKNPTTFQLEKSCAELQNREHAVATSSGMSAMWAAILANIESGDRVLLFYESYAPTRKMVRQKLSRLGVKSSIVSIQNEAEIENAFTLGDVKVVIYESLTNPMLFIPNHDLIIKLAKKYHAKTILDNTFLGLHNNLELEVDFFVHSLTKYANGHGDAMGGIIIGDKENLNQVRDYAVSLGATPDPEASYLILRGLKTYFVRYDIQSRTAQSIVNFLSNHKKVSKVYYPGKESQNFDQLIRHANQFGGIISFDLDVSEKELFKFCDNLNIFTTAASLGSVESLVSPAKLFFGKDLKAEELAIASIGSGTVRISVGMESEDDLISDLSQALDQL